MIDTSNLSEPRAFWNYFQKVSEIPRCSTKEDKIRLYIQEEAEKFGYKTEIDKAGNLRVKLPAGKEATTQIILQSHLDMVCEKNLNITHDFDKDPLKLKIIERNGQKWVTAEGTSLGADNGVGLAYSLTLMNLIHNKKLNFPNLDIILLFTVNEETGLVGAYQVSEDLLNVDYLINLDCMDAQTIIIGSVGGMYSTIQLRLKRISVDTLTDSYIPLKISVKGLLGGHSGLDIDKGRANAIKLLARALRILNKNFEIYLESISGGKNFNAIPREASAILYIKNDKISDISKIIDKIQGQFSIEYSSFEDKVELKQERVEKDDSHKVIMSDLQEKILNMIYLLPHGPLSKHPRMKDVVHSSTNLASIKTTKRKIRIEMLHRSFNLLYNEETAERISALVSLGDLNAKIKNVGGYGVWKPNFKEKLLSLAKKAYKEQSNEEPNITAMHAGLECGVFKSKCPNLQMITIGPTIEACHSPDEKLEVKSVEKFWSCLISLLSQL
jgi:dipeptidase D